MAFIASAFSGGGGYSAETHQTTGPQAGTIGGGSVSFGNVNIGKSNIPTWVYVGGAIVLAIVVAKFLRKR